ncbi:unnamed protein product [Adineta steineri]|uniref:Uncharacterized protein n=1 Tax=Adineta steineri TaxID=433720 RepID=A0A815VW19_9BILA|nr:unnamed protein product [Adineta steineri]CAF1654809.1 unnamed protein product [Adineta steineri]
MPISRTLDYLPLNVLTLCGQEFFQFTKKILGEPEAKLLLKISVKSTSSLLLIEDPLNVFNEDIDDHELESLKEQLCFKLKNEKYLIKPGVVSGFRSLKEDLKIKHDELLKQPVEKQRQRQQLSNVDSSSLCSLAPTTQTTTKPTSLSISEHKEYIVRFINKWCCDNKENVGIEAFNLAQDVDYTINIDGDQISDINASIKCKCGRLIMLGKNNNKIQVSNYYKHLLSIACDHMKKIKQAANDNRSKQQQQQQQQPQPQPQPQQEDQQQEQQQQQQQSLTLPVATTPLSQSNVSSIQFRDVLSPTTAQATSNINSPALAAQGTHNGKRPLASQSQQHRPTKRSRT